jgi:hypothetical protein
MIFHPVLIRVFSKMIIFMKYWWTINTILLLYFEKGSQISKFCILRRYIEFLFFHPILMQFYFLWTENQVGSMSFIVPRTSGSMSFIVPRTSGRMSFIVPRSSGSMLTDFLYFQHFQRLTQPKGANKCQIPKFELSYFSSNFHAIFCWMIIFMGYWMTINKFCFFISKRDLKMAQILKYCIFEIVKQDKCPKYSM